MEKLAVGDPVTVITRMDRLLVRDRMRFVFADNDRMPPLGWGWVGQTHAGFHLHTAGEGTLWTRGHFGPTVEALLAAEALR